MIRPFALPSVFAPIVICFSLPFVVGCGGGASHPETGSVTGTVTMDGQPLPNVSIVFEPTGDTQGRASIGVSDDSGKYSVTYNADVEGALVGKHTVRVTTPSDAPDPSGQAKDPIPKKYNVESELVVEVKSGSNDIPLDLKSK